VKDRTSNAALFQETNMVNKETLESGTNEAAASAPDEELVELGSASGQTRGFLIGFRIEGGILPLIPF
jgi:hypothetical protein